MQQTFTYAIQWIDHGGPYHQPNWQQHVPTALRQMGYEPDTIIVNIGGLALVPKSFNDNDIKLFGYIETTVEIPEWIGQPANLKGNQTRWVEDISLAFYTFEPHHYYQIERKYDVHEFDFVYYQ